MEIVVSWSSTLILKSVPSLYHSFFNSSEVKRGVPDLSSSSRATGRRFSVREPRSIAMENSKRSLSGLRA